MIEHNLPPDFREFGGFFFPFTGITNRKWLPFTRFCLIMDDNRDPFHPKEVILCLFANSARYCARF